MAGGSGINLCAACFAQRRDRPVERDVRCDVALAKFGDKASCVEYLTGAQGYAVFGLLAVDQDEG